MRFWMGLKGSQRLSKGLKGSQGVSKVLDDAKEPKVS